MSIAALFLTVMLFIGLLEIGKRIMSTQDAVDALTARLSKATAEVLSRIAEVQEQLAVAGVPRETVDLSALTAAVVLLDDVVPDVVSDAVPAPLEVAAEVVVVETSVEQVATEEI